MGIINYFKEVKGELKHVAWSTRKQVVAFTTVVIMVSIFTAYFLGAFDFLFTKALDTFVL